MALQIYSKEFFGLNLLLIVIESYKTFSVDFKKDFGSNNLNTLLEM